MRRTIYRLGRGLATLVLVASPAAACLSGLPPQGTGGGDLGPPPAGSWAEIACVEVANDRAGERREVAHGSVPLPLGIDLVDPADLVLVAPGGRRLAAQFEVLSRWGGPLEETILPIRWLELAFPARVAAGDRSSYSLRLYAEPQAPTDPEALTVTAEGALWRVDVGGAAFVLDPGNPALLDRVVLESATGGAPRTVLRHVPGAGPRLLFAAGALHDLGTDQPGEVTVDPAGFVIERQGPVRAVVRTAGHFVAPGGASRCTRGGLDYERFGYTLVATFLRGRREVLFELHLRNECSDGWGGSWTDDALTVDRMSWSLPLDFGGPAAVHWGGGGALHAEPAGSAVSVEQRPGGGSPWRRRARVVAGGVAVESGEAFDSPFVALAGPTFAAAVAMPWMRFREPQALAAAGSALEFVPISSPLVVGEGKGLWSFAVLHLLDAPAGSWEPALEALRASSAWSLERGLVARPTVETLDRAAVLPRLGTPAPTPLEAAYRAVLGELHDQTVSPGGQWDRARTFGSQLWPDVQADPWAIDYVATPADNSAAMNYWNPSGAELLEFLRTGEPRWVWEFALPQSWLQAFTAYLNLGEQIHGNRAGFAVTSGGEGLGQWHRSAFGSDDYSYAMGLWLAYLTRPSPALRARFRQAGATVVDRYSVPEGGGRERWVSEIDLTRQVAQHLWLLADCAEFVPGVAGRACHDRLAAVIAELAEDNLAAGVVCQGDDPSDPCYLPQQFMQNALIYPLLDRLYRNYGDALGPIGRAVRDAPWHLYRFGLPKGPDGVSLDPWGSWAASMECDLTAAGDAVASCVASPDSDGNLGMWGPNKPHTAALLLLSDAHAPGRGLCQVARAAFADPALTGQWSDFLANESGWWKGAAQMLQSMAFAVGLEGTCAGPPLCATAPPRVVLTGGSVGDALAVEACDVIEVGPAFEVVAGGALTLSAGGYVELQNGFTIRAGGVLAAGNDLP